MTNLTFSFHNLFLCRYPLFRSLGSQVHLVSCSGLCFVFTVVPSFVSLFVFICRMLSSAAVCMYDGLHTLLHDHVLRSIDKGCSSNDMVSPV